MTHEATHSHVLLVGFSVPWLHRATEPQRQQLQALQFRLESSRGGVSAASVEAGSSKERVRATLAQSEDDQDWGPGLLETCLIAEGHQHVERTTGSLNHDPRSIAQDVQDDTAGEGSVTGRGTYARRLEARVFEPANWDRVKQYLVGLGLEHLIGPIDDLGVDDLEDFEFLYREDLMEAGATKEEAEAILGCTGAAMEGRAEPPPLARAGHHRPSRPAAQAFQGPAVAARIVHANDRADRVRGAAQGATGSGTGRGASSTGAAQGATGSGTGQGASSTGAAQGATGSGTGRGASSTGAAQGATGSGTQVRVEVLLPQVQHKVPQAQVRVKVLPPQVQHKVPQAQVRVEVLLPQVQHKVPQAQVRVKVLPPQVQHKVPQAQVRVEVLLPQVQHKVPQAQVRAQVLPLQVQHKVPQAQVRAKVLLSQVQHKVPQAQVRVKVLLTPVQHQVPQTQTQIRKHCLRG